VALVVRRRYLTVVPRPMPAAPLRYLAVVPNPSPAAPRRYSQRGAHRTSRTVSTPYEHRTIHGPANGQSTVRYRTTKYDNVRHHKTPNQTPYATPYERRTNTVRDVRSPPLTEDPLAEFKSSL
jgi:hypothetical protein